MDFATARQKFLPTVKKAHWLCSSSIIPKPSALKQKQQGYDLVTHFALIGFPTYAFDFPFNFFSFK